MSRRIAVLTGDLVGSRELSTVDLNRARARLEEAGAALATWQDGLLIGVPEFFRGDSWQLALADPRWFLRVAVSLRAALRGIDNRFDTRIGIGIDAADQVDPARVTLSTGPAFVRSGEAIDSMAGDDRFRVDLPPEMARRLPLLPPLLGLCAEVVDRWQPTQAGAAWHSLDPGAPTQGDVATRLGVSRQVVNRSLATAGLAQIEQAIAAIEAIEWQKLGRPRVRRL